MTRRASPRPGKPTLEQQLAALRQLDPGDPATIDRVRDALRSRTGIVVAQAAKLVAEHRLEAVIDELAPAFERLLEEPVARDPGCRGKAAIVLALHALDRWDDRVFVAGLHHVQPEGWGASKDRDDTAAELRGLCGIAHAQFARGDALAVLASLLADPQRTTRVGAARGLGDAGRPDAAALLRYKILVGDPDPEVIAACVESVLALEKEAAHELLLGLLAGHDERAEVVALALGGARVSAAFAPLVQWCIGAPAEQRHRVGYLAIALLRTEPAIDHLLDAIRKHASPGALAAARALATFKDDITLAARIRAAGREREEAAFDRELEALLRPRA